MQLSHVAHSSINLISTFIIKLLLIILSSQLLPPFKATVAKPTDDLGINQPELVHLEELSEEFLHAINLATQEIVTKYQPANDGSVAIEDLLQRIEVFRYEDYAAIVIDGRQNVDTVFCHLHGSVVDLHCDEVISGNSLPLGAEQVASLDLQALNELMLRLNLPAEIDNSPLWPWIIGGVVTYYLVKKAVNFIFFKKLSSPPSHTHLILLSEQELNQRITLNLSLASTALNSLANFTATPKAEYLQMGDQRKLSLKSGHFIPLETADPAHQSDYSSACQHCGGSHGADSHNSTIPRTGAETANEVLHLKSNNLQAIAKDIHKELFEPLKVIISIGLSTATDKIKRRQIFSIAQTKYHLAKAETDALSAIGILGVLLSLQVAGESLETLVFGPYHIFCHLSTAAVGAVGTGLFAGYHCVRHVLKPGNLRFLGTQVFWSALKAELSPRNFEGDTSPARNIQSFKFEFLKAKRLLSRIATDMLALKLIDPQKAKTINTLLGKLSKEIKELSFVSQLRALTPEETKRITALKQELEDVHLRILTHLAEISIGQASPSCEKVLMQP